MELFFCAVRNIIKLQSPSIQDSKTRYAPSRILISLLSSVTKEHYKLLPDAKGVVYGRLTAELKSRLNSTFTIQFQAVQIGVHIVLNNQTIVKDYRHNSTITKTITLHAHEKNNIYVEFYSLRQDRNISLSFKEILNGNEPNGFCTQSPGSNTEFLLENLIVLFLEGGTLVELKEDILIDGKTTN